MENNIMLKGYPDLSDLTPAQLKWVKTYEAVHGKAYAESLRANVILYPQRRYELAAEDAQAAQDKWVSRTPFPSE